MQRLDLTIRRGATIALPIRLESETLVYRAITVISQSAPVRITATGHGCPDGWRAAVANAGGMTEISFARSEEGKPPKDKDLRRVTLIDANTVEFNGVNAAAFSAYTSGGQLVFYAPQDLSAYVAARMQVKNKVGGTQLALFSTTDGTLEIDAANNAVWLRITEAQWADVAAFSRGFFDLELLTAAGAVTAVNTADSILTVLPEITTATP